jgi:hypothetical protein
MRFGRAGLWMKWGCLPYRQRLRLERERGWGPASSE